MYIIKHKPTGKCIRAIAIYNTWSTQAHSTLTDKTGTSWGTKAGVLNWIKKAKKRGLPKGTKKEEFKIVKMILTEGESYDMDGALDISHSTQTPSEDFSTIGNDDEVQTS